MFGFLSSTGPEVENPTIRTGVNPCPGPGKLPKKSHTRLFFYGCVKKLDG
jgi:hypothetical protein